MKGRVYSLSLICMLVLSCCEDLPEDNCSKEYISVYYEIVEYAQLQLYYLVNNVDSIKKQTEEFVVPVYYQDDHMLVSGIYDWRSGFYPGILWQMYQLTYDEFWLNKAIENTLPLSPVQSYSKHDLGFMINNSFGKGYDIINDPSYKDVLVNSAKTLISRYNSIVGCIKSWNSSKKWKYPVIIDNMMNLELLFRATELSGDSIYWKIACNHANKTIENHFRDNGSSFHVVDYDSITGSVIQKKTSQGYSDESYWTRGQAWALYGFTMCYRYTRSEKYLNQAKKIANFLIGLQYAEDYVPYWDMLSPDIPNTPRDVSAAVIMASAFIELSEYCKDSFGQVLFEKAKQIILSVHSSYENRMGCDGGFLLNHSVGSFPTGNEIDVPIIYADYYYLEAVLRLLNK